MRAGTPCGFISLVKGCCLCLLAVSFAAHQALASGSDRQSASPTHPLAAHQAAVARSSPETKASATHRPDRVNFEGALASHDVRYLADWVVDSRDNRSMPFAIVDKTDAKVFVFYADGQLRGAAPSLDHSE